MLYIALIFGLAALFMTAERILPGRELPIVPHWYLRAALLNSCQLGIIVLAGYTWNRWFMGWSMLSIADQMPSILQGFFSWFVGTFVFYWWHRLRHGSRWCWLVFHQIHHSPARIEMLTAFYKHPLEIAVNSIIASAIIYLVLGGSLQAAAWFNIFAAAGEMFYHSNLRTAHWLGYFIQRPEHHSIHHEVDVHDFNYGDITWWDRLFGTFRDADKFASRCGFPNDTEQSLIPMFAFTDVYRQGIPKLNSTP